MRLAILQMTVKMYLKRCDIDTSCSKGTAIIQHRSKPTSGQKSFVLNWLQVQKAEPSALPLYGGTAGYASVSLDTLGTS